MHTVLFSKTFRYCKVRHKRYRTANICIKHPRSCFSKSALCFVNQCTKNISLTPSNNFDTMIKVPTTPGFNPTVFVRYNITNEERMHTRHFLPDLRFHTPPCYTISGISFLPCETAPFDDPYFCSHNFVIDSI